LLQKRNNFLWETANVKTVALRTILAILVIILGTVSLLYFGAIAPLL
jgi:hypothetical protein